MPKRHNEVKLPNSRPSKLTEISCAPHETTWRECASVDRTLDAAVGIQRRARANRNCDDGFAGVDSLFGAIVC